MQAALAFREAAPVDTNVLRELLLRLRYLRNNRELFPRWQAEEAALVLHLHELRKQLAPSPEELRRRLPLLSKVHVATPCDVPWDTMTGDDRKRFCSQCSKHVYNLSEMSAQEAETLLRSAEGRELCVQLYRRADGTVLTQDCPVGVRVEAERVYRYFYRAGAAVAVVLAAALVYAWAEERSHHYRYGGHSYPTGGAAAIPLDR